MQAVYLALTNKQANVLKIHRMTLFDGGEIFLAALLCTKALSSKIEYLPTHAFYKMQL